MGASAPLLPFGRPRFRCNGTDGGRADVEGDVGCGTCCSESSPIAVDGAVERDGSVYRCLDVVSVLEIDADVALS